MEAIHLGSIPHSEIIMYLDEQEVEDSDDRDDFVCLIQAMDVAYIEFHENKVKQMRDKNKAKKKR